MSFADLVRRKKDNDLMKIRSEEYADGSEKPVLRLTQNCNHFASSGISVSSYGRAYCQ